MVPLVFALLSSAAIAVGGCGGSDSGSGGGKTGGTSGGGTGGSASGTGSTSGSGGTSGGSPNDLVPTATGFVENADVGVVGAWYAYGDSIGDDGSPGTGKCETVGKLPDSSCSTLTAPDITMTKTLGFPPTDLATGKMCTAGTAAKVIASTADSSADYTNIFGLGIGFDFNNPGADKGGKQPWDATAHNVVGVSFDIDMVPTDGFRVEFATVANGNDNPYWGGGSSNTSKMVKAGTNTVMFSDVNGPMYVAAAKRVAPDWTKLLSIQFHVSTGTAKAIPFNYCISNLKLITQ